MRILLNAIIAKKNAGGAFQIAKNFMSMALSDKKVEWFFVISEDLASVMEECIHGRNDVFVISTQPQFKSYHRTQKELYRIETACNPDVVYSILAPSYYRFKTKEVMRCTNSWDLIGWNDLAFKTLPFKTKIQYSLKSNLMRLLMRRSKYFVTQSETAKKGIERVTKATGNCIKVVPNVLPHYYQQSLPHKIDHKGINIVYVANPSPHKNIEIIPEVARILKTRFGHNKFSFLVTIPDKCEKELNTFWGLAKNYGVENNIINIGYKTQASLVDVYNKCDIGFFPSLLETFSATLLEYMYFGLPIVASRRGFNTEVADDAALYFAPKNSEQAADCIHQILSNNISKEDLISKGYERLLLYKDYRKHYLDTVEFLASVVAK